MPRAKTAKQLPQEPSTLETCETLVQQIRLLAITARGEAWWLAMRAPGAIDHLAADAFFFAWDRTDLRSIVVLRGMELYRHYGQIPSTEPSVALPHIKP